MCYDLRVHPEFKIVSKISPTHTSAVIDLPKLLALNDGQPVGPGSRILRFAGQLISIASVLPPETPYASTVRCRRRPKRRACEGSLTIIRRSIEDDIVWECPRCGDRGHIVGWQDSHWDREPALRSGAIVSLLQVRAERAEHPRDAHPKLGQPSPILEFQVELIGGPQDLTEIVTRRVRINGERSLHDLHLLLQRAFDRDTNEPYEFMFGAPYEPAARRFSGGIIASSEETNEPWETQTLTLDNLNLQLGQAFGYLFDFGEEWVHRVTLISTEKDLSGATYARVIERVGASPP
ncbi:MAG: hypothetical protein KAI47_13355, partial [Deltaproteobacteria bacterium]|nr:hypothetical protein [Deltaproteobacteria bacterium]